MGQLAAYTGISTAQISRLESGERANPASDGLAEIAAKLDTTVDYLVGLTDQPLPQGEEIETQTALEWQLLELFREFPPEQQDIILRQLMFMILHPPLGDQDVAGAIVRKGKAAPRQP